MRAPRQVLWSSLAIFALLCISATTSPAQSKGNHKHYVVSGDKAVSVTRTVLVERGYQVVKVERVGATQVVYFRRGSRGRGKGKGPVQRMVIRTVRDRVVFEDTEPSILMDIDVRLRL